MSESEKAPAMGEVSGHPAQPRPSESVASAQVTAHHGGGRPHVAPQRTGGSHAVPRWLLIVAAIVLFDTAAAFAYFPQIGAVSLVFILTLICGVWAYRSGDLLVASLAVLLLWLPFSVSATRFGISPQEVLLYAIWLCGMLFNAGGARRWLIQVFSSVTPLARFALLLYAIAIGQSEVRVAHADIVALTTSIRHIVVYPILLAFIVAYAIRTRRCMPTLLLAFVAGAGLFAVYALTLRVVGAPVGIGAVVGRLGSEASIFDQYTPNSLGLYLIFGLAFVPALVHLAMRTRAGGDMLLAATCAGATLTLLAFWMTYSRGALLALFAAGVVALLGGMLLTRRRQRAVLFGAAGAVAVVVVLLVVSGAHVLGRYQQLADPAALLDDPNVQFRIALYQRAWNLIRAHPLTGVGLGGFTQGSGVPFSPHDTYLDVLVSSGLFGAIGMMLVMGIGVFVALRLFLRFRALDAGTNTLYMLGVAVALTGFLVQAFTESFTGNPRIYPAMWFFVACAEGTLLALASPSRARATEQPAAAVSGAAKAQPMSAEADAPGDIEDSTLPPATSVDGAAVLSFETLFETSGEFMIVRAGTTDRLNASTSSDRDQEHDTGRARERAVSQALLRQAPVSYLWNQAYTLWYFAMNFLLSVVIARQLSQEEYGIYAILLTMLTTLQFLCAFGLEDVATVFLPRLLSSGGRGLAGALVRRVLLIRTQVLVVIGTLLLLGMPPAIMLLTRAGIPLDFTLLGGPHGFRLRIALMVAFLVGTGIVSIEGALFASVLRSRVTLVVGGTSQALNVVLAAVILALGGGIDGLFAVLAAVAWLTAFAYLVPLRRLLLARRRRTLREGNEISKLMLSAWLVNITNGALGKQSDILLMGVFAVSFAAIGNYNLAYQLANILGVLLVSGLGGVGPAAMSAAFSAGGLPRLAEIWRATIMFQILVTIPVLMFAIMDAGPLVTTLYSNRYDGAVPMLQLFLVATIAGRLVGGGAHQSALYVLGKQRLVMITRWIGLVVNIALDVLLIPVYGPYGALVATSVTQILVGAIEHLFVRRYVPVRYPVTFAGQVVGASALAAAPLLVLPPHNIVTLAFAFGGFVIALIIGLLLLGLGEADDFRRVLALRPGLLEGWTRVWNRLLGEQTPRQALASEIVATGSASFAPSRQVTASTTSTTSTATDAIGALSMMPEPLTADRPVLHRRDVPRELERGPARPLYLPATATTSAHSDTKAQTSRESRDAPMRWSLAARASRADVLFCAVVMLGGAVIRWWQLSSQSLWIDESSSLLLAAPHPVALIQGLLRFDTHPPLYYLVVHYALAAHLSPLYAVRVPSLICGTLSIGIMYGIGRMLVGRASGLVAGILTMLSPLAVWYSDDGRMYALVWCCVLLSYLLLILVVRQPRWYWAVAYGVAVALALYADISALLGIVPQFLLLAGVLGWGAVTQRGWRASLAPGWARGWLLAGGGYAGGWVLFLPWLALLPRQLTLIQSVHFGMATGQQFWTLLLADLGLGGSYAFLDSTLPPLMTLVMMAALLVAIGIVVWSLRLPRYRLYAGVVASLTLGVALVFGALVLAGSRAVLVPRVVGIASFGCTLIVAGTIGILVQRVSSPTGVAKPRNQGPNGKAASGKHTLALMLPILLLVIYTGGTATALATLNARGTNASHWNDIAHQIALQAQPDDVVMYYPLGIKAIIDPYLPTDSPWRTQAKGLWPQTGVSPQSYFDQNLPGHAHIWFLYYGSSEITMPVYDTWIQAMGYCRAQGDPQARYGLVLYTACR